MLSGDWNDRIRQGEASERALRVEPEKRSAMAASLAQSVPKGELTANMGKKTALREMNLPAGVGQQRY